MSEEIKKTYSHYYKECPFTHVDVYRVLQLFSVNDPCLQHTIKKLLVVGGRGAKDAEKDVKEAIVSLQRWVEMREEEIQKPIPKVISFVVNGYGCAASGDTIHYDDVIRGCGIKPRLGSAIETVEWTDSNGERGYLTPGCHMNAVPGLSFLVTR